nr:hypothetical protein [Vibrio cyclitrophicus]
MQIFNQVAKFAQPLHTVIEGGLVEPPIEGETSEEVRKIKQGCP